MDKLIKETLEINNFFSINHLKWEIKRFNIITGDMGVGKSLCIKLLKFFEDIIPNLLILPYENFVNLNTKNYASFIIKDFKELFDVQSLMLKNQLLFRADYEFSYNENLFKMSLLCNGNDINFESPSLDNLLENWYKHLQKKENETPDGLKETKKSLYSALLQKFDNYFPIATTFIPASRASLANSSNYIDPYLKEFKSLVDVLPRFESRKLEIINTILKAEINIEEGSLFLKSEDGRKEPLAKASSGQQEIVYLLMLLDKLGNFYYTYGSYHSIFIEEPEAQIFPLNQKQIIELIVSRFNELKENGNSIRFFITTHSPYILNALNNILEKGALLKKYENFSEKINSKIDIPHLYTDEISANFLSQDDGWENMLVEDENYLDTKKIAEISYAIDRVSTELSELKNELSSEEVL